MEREGGGEGRREGGREGVKKRRRQEEVSKRGRSDAHAHTP